MKILRKLVLATAAMFLISNLIAFVAYMVSPKARKFLDEYVTP